jgi:FAD synthetase
MSSGTPEAHPVTGNDVRDDHGESNNIVETRIDAVSIIYGDLAARIDQFLQDANPNSVRSGTQLKVRESLQVIAKALHDYGYPYSEYFETDSSFDSLALSFNGGKDCLVLLLLYIYVLHQNHSLIRRIPTCFVTPMQTFSEIDEFVTECAQRYSLDVERISLPMKSAFTQYLNHNKHVNAVLEGTRRTDPHGEFLTHFDHTDHGWPAFMRVHPVIDWHYWEIWDVVSIFDWAKGSSCGRFRCHIVFCTIRGMSYYNLTVDLG